MSGKIKHLQMYKGNFRVRMGVPAKCRQHLIPPHTGKSELVRGLGTANQTVAGKLAAPFIAEFHAIIEQARREAVPMEWQHYRVPPQPYNGFGGARLGRTQVPVGTQ